MKYNDSNNLLIYSESGGEPVSVDEVKAQLNMSFSGAGNFGDDDQYISDLIPVCREQIENYCGISIKNKTIVVELRNECGMIELPLGPILSIISAFDSNGYSVTLTTMGDKWKSVVSPTIDYIKVTYSVGYMGLGYNSVPKSLKHAIIEECAWRYLNRGTAQGLGSVQAKGLCSPYKRKAWLM